MHKVSRHKDTRHPRPPKPRTRKPRPPLPVEPPEFQTAAIDARSEPELIKLLTDAKSTSFEKAKAAQRLATVGTKASVPALTALLRETKLSTYARNALESIPDPAADAALLAAVPKLEGVLQIGVINSIARRKDPKAAPLLSKLLYDPDPLVAQAAAAALGHISGPEASKALQAGLGRTKGMVRNAVADGALICAEELLARGERDQAMALYTFLTLPDIAKPARLAAMHNIIRAETSLTRPRSAPPATP